ncbi:flagellar basal-body MS-ring/collar protein FliF [Pseudomonas sp. PLMAX]|uniref:flagellar basal-body MS-ring/collar protein FliF n=1 Tax=Pseudomonas sp. PLMAX TaxID=2201998 RepID=UPI0038B879B4
MHVSDPTQAKMATSSAAPTASAGYQQLLTFAKKKPIIPIVAIGATVSIIAGLFMWANSTEYRVMYSNISDADGGQIITELQKKNIPFKLGQDGHTLLVPADQVHTLRLQLAEQGLPKAGNVGFELLDNQSFGISQFAEHINFQRGLEGELARSIESLGPVASARVHLVMAKNSVFARDREAASASVVLNLQPGRELGPGQVESITYMVASSVPHLPVESVTVVDQQGRLLSRPSRGKNKDLDSTQLAYTDEIETSYQRRIETILAPIVGQNNVKAQVTAQIDFATREQTAEKYGPNQPPNEAAIRSQQITENYSDGDFARGVPGALTNSPPNAPAITTPTGGAKPPAKGAQAKNQAQANQATATTQADAGAGRHGTMSSDKMINYEVDRNIEHVQQHRGGVMRLSAAVVVNYKEVTDSEGKVSNVALTEEEMAGINRLVRQAMGFSAQRGDEVAVINSPFNNTKETIEELVWWKTPEFFNLASTLSKNLMVLLAGLLAYFAGVRPFLRKRTQAVEAEKAALVIEQQRAAEAAQQSAQPQQDEKAPPFRRRKPSYESNLQGFREMAMEDPQLVAGVLSSWMKENK